MSAREIEAGRGFVRVFADLNPLDAGLKRLEAKMKSFGSGISSIGSRVAGVGAGVAAIGTSVLAPIAAATMRFANFGSTIKDTADRTGISAKSISELGYAAEQSGTDLETVEGATRKMQKGITSAAAGGGAMAKAFASIGLNAAQLAKLAPEQQFDMVAKAIGNVADPTQRAAKAMEIFGKSGVKLLPMIRDMDALRQEARDLGISISDIDAANAEELGDAFSKFARVIGGIGNQIGAAIAAPLTKIINSVSAITAKASQWIAANQGIVQTIAAIAAGAVAVGAIIAGVGIAIVGVGATISALGAIIGGIVATVTTVFGAVAAVIGALLSPIGLVVAAVVGLGVYITYAALSATGSLTKLSEMFGSLGGTAVEAWNGIVAAISTGDFETAGQIAFGAIEVAWLTVTGTIQQVWANVTDFFVNVWRSAVESIVQIGASIYFGIAKYFDQLSNALVAGFDIAVTYITGAIDGIQTAIAKAIIKAQEFFGFFGKDQSVQIQASLDSELKRRSDGRQKGLDSRSNERGQALDQRDQQRQATQQQFSTIVSEDFKRAKTKVQNPALSEAQKRLEELKLNLSTKAAEAQAKAAEAQKNPKSEAVANAQSSAANLISESGGSTGTFVSGVSASIAGGGVSPLEDLGKQQLERLDSIDNRMREATVGDDE